VWNTVFWALIVCASVCTVGSLLGSHAPGRMWRVDVLELRRRRRMIEVLEENTRYLHREPDAVGVDRS
jgi:hypothetical protein